jgi:hypothetical protein
VLTFANSSHDPFVPLVPAIESLEIGEVYFTESLSHTIDVFNRSSRGIDVAKFQTSCDCATVGQMPVHIPANGRAAVRAEINLSKYIPLSTRQTRVFTVTLLPISVDGLPLSTTWQVTGSVRSWVSPSRASIDFGEVPVLSIRDATDAFPVEVVTLMSVDDTIEEVKASAEHPSLRVQICDTYPSVKGSRQLEMSCILSDAAECGLLATSIQLVGKARSGSNPPPFRLPVFARLVPDVSIEPRALITDADSVDSYVNVTLTSRSGRQFVVDKISLADSGKMTSEQVGECSHGRISYRLGLLKRLSNTEITFHIQIPQIDGYTEQVLLPVIYHSSH